jgi:hypothetical protein
MTQQGGISMTTSAECWAVLSVDDMDLSAAKVVISVYSDLADAEAAAEALTDGVEHFARVYLCSVVKGLSPTRG